MEDMDLDQVVYVPDTPDRLDAEHMMGRESVGKVRNSPLACDLSNPDRADTNYVNQPSVKGRLFSENGHVRRLVIRPPRNIDNIDIKSCSNSNGDNSSASRNAHDFRRAAVGKHHEAKHSTGTENMDKGKAMSIKSSSKSSAYHEKPKVFDLTKQKGHGQSPRNVFPHGELEHLDAEDIRKEQMMSVGSSTVHCIQGHSERSRNAVKGKEKIDDRSFKGLSLATALGKGVHLSPDPQCVMVQQKPMSHHSFTLPRAGCQKRLVRNGCISPHNIATRKKQLAEQHNDASEGTEQSHAGKVDSNGSPYVIDISDIVNEDNNSQMLKGKGKDLLIHSFPPEENNARTIHASSRSLVNDNIEANRTSDLGSNISGRSEGLGGWRSTRNSSGQVDYIFPDSTEHQPSRVNGVGNFVIQHHNRVDRRDTRSRGNQRTGDDSSENLNATQTASGLVCELDRISGPSHDAKTVIKRHKKRGLSLRNHAECSTLVPDDSDIVFLGSSGASESSRSSRSRSQVIEVDELSPAAGHSVPQGIDAVHDDSDAKARQLEADEMLARELQEQLYHEVPITGGGEIDEHLAWALHQEENASNTSRGSHNSIHRGGSTILHSNRQPRPESFQNHANRRATQARVPTSSRMAQLRTRFRNQSGRVPTRARNLRFPSDMDLDMRMNILEALEAAFDVGPENHMLQVQRDFNDNDYEMLLALDENNHQHAGATGQQINNLPQSTVQMASEEACAICLETPTIGETVRHLPCLHRFHKDCIDPWLSRRTSCPVCKCSIT